MKNLLCPHVLVFFWLWALPLAAGQPGARNVVRRGMSFSEVLIPVLNEAPVRLAITELEVFDRPEEEDEATFRATTTASQFARWKLQRELLEIAEDWYLRHLAKSTPGRPLAPGFLANLKNTHSIFLGRSSVVVLSDPQDFRKIYGLVRVAKPSLRHPQLPLQRQFGARLQPLPVPTFRKKSSGRLKLYSHRHEEPHYIDILNLPLYSGDIVELKHYSAKFRRDINLTSVLYEVAQEATVFAISRSEDGGDLGLAAGPVLITPALIAAETDDPGVLRRLLASGFNIHQTFPGEIHTQRDTHVLLGNPEEFQTAFRAVNEQRHHAWQLPKLEIVDRNEKDFLKSFLPESCARALALRSLRYYESDFERLVDEAWESHRP